jgi:phenylalanyl-tRNA synthetase alpha subunit
MVFDGTLDECIQQFMSKPVSQHQLYEIYTAPQAELITTILSAEQIVELAGCGIFSKVVGLILPAYGFGLLPCNSEDDAHSSTSGRNL